MTLELTDNLNILKEYKNLSYDTKIKDIYRQPNLKKLLMTKCIDKIKEKDNLPENVREDLCRCLFHKNKNLSLNQLKNKLTNNKYLDSLTCINIKDTYLSSIGKSQLGSTPTITKFKTSKSSKSKTSKSKSSKSKTSKSKSSKSKSSKNKTSKSKSSKSKSSKSKSSKSKSSKSKSSKSK